MYEVYTNERNKNRMSKNTNIWNLHDIECLPIEYCKTLNIAVLMGEAFDVMKKDVLKALYRLESFAVLMGEAFGLNVNPKSNDESTDKKLKYFVNTSNLPQKGQSGQGIRHEGGWIQHCCSTYACRYFHHFTWGER